MTAKPRLSTFPMLQHCHPCKRCGNLPRHYQAPHDDDLSYHWAGCGCRNTEPRRLAEEPELIQEWSTING